MWNATADVHARIKLQGLLESFRRPDFSLLDPVEIDAFRRVGVRGKSVTQLCCNNGRELLCVERLGAGRCVGFDISDAFVAQARELASAAGSAAEFVTTDVYDIPSSYDDAFDLAFVTVGALGWFPDLTDWYAVVRRIVRPGGHLLIYEMHPILDMFDASAGTRLRHSYFRTEPYAADSGPDYYDPNATIDAPSYWFHHTLADVLGGAIEAGFDIRRFEEFGHDVSEVYRAFEDEPAKPPLSYLLVARRAGGGS